MIRLELVASSSRSGQGVIQAFTDWRQLIRSVEGPQAVAITTPPGPRYEIARECILAGLHCLLEKPPTAGLAEINDLACLAEAQQVSLFTTWHAQHHSTVDAAAQALAGKRIRSMEILWHEDVHKWHPGQQWIWEAGGFGVFDPGINAFSIATKIFPGGLFVKSAEFSVPGECPDAHRRGYRLFQSRSGRAAYCKPRLASRGRRGVDHLGNDCRRNIRPP